MDREKPSAEEIARQRAEKKKAKALRKGGGKPDASPADEGDQSGGGRRSRTNSENKPDAEEIKRQRAAKKAAKQAKKSKSANKDASETVDSNADADSGSEGRPRRPSAMQSKPTSGPAPMLQFDDPKKYAKYAKKSMIQRTQVQKQVELFSHLPQYERESSLSLQVGFSKNELPPAIVRLGLKFAEGSICGSNARCVSLMSALKEFIMGYTAPPQTVMSLHLHSAIKPLVRFLIDCRPQSISMGNALRYLKANIAQLPTDIPEDDAKALLCRQIDSFVQERVQFADEVIAANGSSRIADGEVVLTYAKSAVVEMLLKRAFDDGKKFRVIVVDGRPRMEGKELLRRLVKHGLNCTYMTINAVSYVMQTQVSKVFLGAAALLANGTCISRVGAAVVAMMAHTYNKPVLVCCETYKFHERVQLDSICFNELGDPDDLIKIHDEEAIVGSKNADVLTDWRDVQNLKLLNLNYDLTPANFISMVITELGVIPATSVPVILREYHKDQRLL